MRDNEKVIGQLNLALSAPGLFLPILAPNPAHFPVCYQAGERHRAAVSGGTGL